MGFVFQNYNLILIPINSLIEKTSGLTGLAAQLSAPSSAILIAISVTITVLGGLIPAKKAKKRPCNRAQNGIIFSTYLYSENI